MVLAQFFKFKNLWAWFENQIWFHVHIPQDCILYKYENLHKLKTGIHKYN